MYYYDLELVNLNMKFRWLPWYNTTFETDETRVEFLQRVRKAIHHDDWKEKNSGYIGFVYGSKSRIFFKRVLANFSLIKVKELQANYSMILFSNMVEKDGKCKIEMIISLYWLGYLIFLPLFIFPIIESVLKHEPLFLLLSLTVYIVALLFFNLRAHILYNLFLKIFHNKLDIY